MLRIPVFLRLRGFASGLTHFPRKIMAGREYRPSRPRFNDSPYLWIKTHRTEQSRIALSFYRSMRKRPGTVYVVSGAI